MLVPSYLILVGLVIWLVGREVGREIFPTVDTGQFQLRLRAADGTRIEVTEQIAVKALEFIKEEVGPENVELSVGYIGLIGSSYPINNIFLWTRGPEEAVLRVALKPGSGVRVEKLKHDLREKLPQRLGEWLDGHLRAEGLSSELVAQRVSGLKLSFEPADVVNEVMSFGSPTPVEVAVSGPDFAETRVYAEKVKSELARIPSLKERFAALVKDNVLTRQSKEETDNQFRSAESGLAEASAKVASAKAMEQEKVVAREKAEVDIRAAKAAQQTQADLVGYATLKAPYDGVVTQKSVNTQQFVQPAPSSVQGGKGDVLYVIEKTDRVRIFMAVPETDADWVRIGLTATVRVRGLQGQEFKHEVTRTASSLDPVSRTLLTEIEVENPLKDPRLPKLGRWLQPGMYAYITIDAERPDVLTLPASAVVTEGDVNVGYQTFCYIVGADNRLHRTQIKIGARNDNLVEVLKKRTKHGEEAHWEAFTQAEEVVGGDLSRLEDGQLVEMNRSGK